MKLVKAQMSECKKELAALAKKSKKTTEQRDRLAQELQHLEEEV